MTRYELNNRYFEWMYDKVIRNALKQVKSYKKLFTYLHGVDFNYILDMDSNRAEDGVDLRYRFAYEQDIDPRLAATYLDNRPCSVLEMIIALAIRCEEDIADDPEIGDRTSNWFWDMMSSLGLQYFDDEWYDEKQIATIVDKFLYRKYARNGKGGLFCIPGIDKDMRSAEIWYQAMWYFDTCLIS